MGEAGTKNCLVTILDDQLAEGLESVGLKLMSPGGGASLGSTASLTINENDGGPGSWRATRTESAGEWRRHV